MALTGGAPGTDDGHVRVTVSDGDVGLVERDHVARTEIGLVHEPLHDRVRVGLDVADANRVDAAERSQPRAREALRLASPGGPVPTPSLQAPLCAPAAACPRRRVSRDPWLRAVHHDPFPLAVRSLAVRSLSTDHSARHGPYESSGGKSGSSSSHSSYGHRCRVERRRLRGAAHQTGGGGGLVGS